MTVSGSFSPSGGQKDQERSDEEPVVTEFGGVVRPCQMLNCPITARGLCIHCGFRTVPSCVVEVCRYCYSTNLLGANHGISVSDGTPEGGMAACLWPCNHEVQDREVRCLVCDPYPDSEVPF